MQREAASTDPVEEPNILLCGGYSVANLTDEQP
jgi:hypothetical protein